MEEKNTQGGALPNENNPTENQLLNAALAYARCGYRVFPCIPGEKKPANQHGCLEATTDEEQILRWWHEKPTANIGLSTDGLLALDVDGDQNVWLTNDTDRLNSLSSTPTQRTPRGGLHFIYRQPDTARWSCTTSKVATNVDTRANGGYILVAPSRTSAGNVYAWLPHHALTCMPEELPTPPTWLAEQLEELASGKRLTFAEPTGGDTKTQEIPSGRRNSTLISLAGYMRRGGFCQEEIEQALQSANRLRCVPPLPEKEVSGIAASAARYEPDQIASLLAEGGVHWDEVDHEAEPAHPGSFPEQLLDVPGVIGAIVKHNLATAQRKQPVLALGAALALMATITGRKITDSLGTQTNLYCVGLASSGSGKEHARTLNKRILQDANCSELIGPESIGSSAGLISAIGGKNPTQLFQLDEMGRFLKTLKSPNTAPHLYNIVTVLLKLYTSAGQLYIGDAYADLKKVKTIHWPHACVYGTTVPESFYDSLTRESLTDGFVARLLVFQSDQLNAPRLESKDLVPVPKNITDVFKFWHDYNPGGNLSNEHPHPTVIAYSPEAIEVLQAFVDLCETEQVRAGEQNCGAIWLRTVEKARKLALIAAVALGGPECVVKPETAVWACRLSEYLCRKVIYHAGLNVADTPAEMIGKRMLRMICDSGLNGVTRTQIAKRFQGISMRQRKDHLENLMEAGLILSRESRSASGPGRPKTVYVSPSNL